MTGAGVSAASGVPTFRGPGGLWKSHRAEELATPEAFARNPGLVWEWYDWRRQQIAACEPNPAHLVLAAWARRLPGFSLITQNVDGLHERTLGNPEGLPPQRAAGGDNPLGSPEIIRLHGSIWEVLCWKGCAGSPPRWRDESVPLSPMPPLCPHCGGLVRPGVVWFGEPLDWAALQQADEAATCDVFLTVGTSAVVYPAASFVQHARRRGAFTVEVNPDATPASDAVDLVLRGPAETVLPELESLL
jgi:NAD-dependent deacetylase